MDVASHCHRVARLGLDCNLDDEEEELRLSAQARAMVADPSNSGETNGKHVADIFGQTHPAVANEIFECMNCGRSIMAGRFTLHLEKCMGKGRKARLKSTRSDGVLRLHNDSLVVALFLHMLHIPILWACKPLVKQQME